MTSSKQMPFLQLSEAICSRYDEKRIIRTGDNKMNERNIPTEVVAKLLAAGAAQGERLAQDVAVELWSVTNMAVAMLIADLHRAGMIDAEQLADRLLRQADQSGVSELSRQAIGTLAAQVLGYAAQGDPPLRP
jgi:hypothetical protein